MPTFLLVCLASEEAISTEVLNCNEPSNIVSVAAGALLVAAQKHGFRQPSLQRILLLLGLLVEIRMVLVVPLLSSGKSTPFL